METEKPITLHFHLILNLKLYDNIGWTANWRPNTHSDQNTENIEIEAVKTTIIIIQNCLMKTEN